MSMIDISRCSQETKSSFVKYQGSSYKHPSSKACSKKLFRYKNMLQRNALKVFFNRSARFTFDIYNRDCISSLYQSRCLTYYTYVRTCRPQYMHTYLCG